MSGLAAVSRWVDGLESVSVYRSAAVSRWVDGLESVSVYRSAAVSRWVDGLESVSVYRSAAVSRWVDGLESVSVYRSAAVLLSAPVQVRPANQIADQTARQLPASPSVAGQSQGRLVSTPLLP